MRTRAPALLVLVALAVAPSPLPAAEASCAAPTLEIATDGGTAGEGPTPGGERSPVVLARGATLTVTGRGFVEGCDDTRDESAFGCSRSDEPQSPPPSTGVELVLLRGQPTMSQTPLGVADATNDGEQPGLVTWTVTVPERYPLGRAVLKTEGSEPLPVRIVR